MIFICPSDGDLKSPLYPSVLFISACLNLDRQHSVFAMSRIKKHQEKYRHLITKVSDDPCFVCSKFNLMRGFFSHQISNSNNVEGILHDYFIASIALQEEKLYIIFKELLILYCFHFDHDEFN